MSEIILNSDQPRGPFPRIEPHMLNESIRAIRVPDLMRHRPVSRKGFPVPFFVAWVDGDWDFRVVYPEITVACLKQKLCWLCGHPMGVKQVFVSGPMCVVTRTSAEPPSHQSCAEYAAIACPFLANPAMRRNEKDLPAGHLDAAGVMIKRNPGVTAVLITDSYSVFPDGAGGILVHMGAPRHVKWFAQRRAATQKEVMDSVESGLPALVEQCNAEPDEAKRKEAHYQLGEMLVDALRWLPRPLPGQPDLLARGGGRLSKE